ncbi:MAG: hypothetical protein EBZ51_10205 [Synechococcaceae bacterium WB9_2_112]|nr:hypothetical protein [Synechococcaceae bacterium WB9_2_112]
MRALVLTLVLVCTLMARPAVVLAGPLNWHEVPASPAGRQWWDEGSLRFNRDGALTVLSRFQPVEADDLTTTRPRSLGDLYVMQIDCEQNLFRDTSINGIPRWRSEWHPADGDALTEAVVQQSCAAASLLNPTSPTRPA